MRDRRHRLRQAAFAVVGATFFPSLLFQERACSQTLPAVESVELQPLAAQVRRIAIALQRSGAPLSPSQQEALDQALAVTDEREAAQAVQAVLDPLCLVGVHINPESRVKVTEGPAPLELIEHGWRTFLVKVHNEAGVTSELRCYSPNAQPMHDRSRGDHRPPKTISQQDVRDRWCDVHMNNERPLRERLSGLALEYRILEVYSRDVGQREAELTLDVGDGSADVGGRSSVNLLFKCQQSVAVKLRVLDHDGSPTTGRFTFRDRRRRVYPATARRLAPDFFFHDQVYRGNGETVRLPPGEYHVTYTPRTGISSVGA